MKWLLISVFIPTGCGGFFGDFFSAFESATFSSGFCAWLGAFFFRCGRLGSCQKACGKSDCSQTMVNAKTADSASLFHSRKITVAISEDRGKKTLSICAKRSIQ
jgi:hypothetical protein